MSEDSSTPESAAGVAGPSGNTPLRATESTTTLINGIGHLSTNDREERDPSPGPSASNVCITVNNDNKRKRLNTGTGNPPKRGKPNIPPEVETLYKQARNSRTRAAKYMANEMMLRKYMGHSEHIAPNNMKIRTTPPFGADDPQVRKQWANIISTAEKSMLECQASYLRTLIATEESKAEMALSKAKAQLGPNIAAYGEADAASVAVATRVRAAEIQKLRYRWVHDVQRHETEKIGLPLPPKGKGKGKKSPPKGKATSRKEPTTTRRTSKGKRRLNPGNDNSTPGTSGTGNNARANPPRTPQGNPDANLFRMFAELLQNRI